MESPAQHSPVLTRVKKAYEQVADQLREAILRGEFVAGQRLPREVEMAELLGVSRSTVREALRVLASENLVRTTKGATGGTFIAKPSLDYVSEFMTTQINLLTAAQEVSLEEMLELRELIEVHAAHLAAGRRSDEELRQLERTIPPLQDHLSHSEVSALNRSFHLSILELTHNRLLYLSAQPIYATLESHSERSSLSTHDHSSIVGEHAAIFELISNGDPEGAARAMREHQVKLRTMTKRVWRSAGRIIEQPSEASG